VLLADTIAENSFVLPLFRNDHYFNWGISELKMQAIVSFVVEENQKR
jgi:hypothetical protein